MAGMTRLSQIAIVDFEFSENEWSNLSPSAETLLSIKARATIMECVQEYIVEAISHYNGVPLQKTEISLKKIISSTEKTVSELEKILYSSDVFTAADLEDKIKSHKDSKWPNEKFYADKISELQKKDKNKEEEINELTKIALEKKTAWEYDKKEMMKRYNDHGQTLIQETNDPYFIIKTLLSSLYDKEADPQITLKNELEMQFGYPANLDSTIKELVSIVSKCQKTLKDLKDFEIKENFLDVFLSKLAEIFVNETGKKRLSPECLSFIRTVCLMVHEKLEPSHRDKTFSKLKVISLDDSEGWERRLISRVQDGRCFKKK